MDHGTSILDLDLAIQIQVSFTEFENLKNPGIQPRHYLFNRQNDIQKRPCMPLSVLFVSNDDAPIYFYMTINNNQVYINHDDSTNHDQTNVKRIYQKYAYR